MKYFLSLILILLTKSKTYDTKNVGLLLVTLLVKYVFNHSTFSNNEELRKNLALSFWL